MNESSDKQYWMTFKSIQRWNKSNIDSILIQYFHVSHSDLTSVNSWCQLLGNDSNP